MLDTLSRVLRPSDRNGDMKESKPRQEVEIDDFDDMFTRAREARIPMERHWMENLAFYMGQQWLLWDEATKNLELPELPDWRVLYTGNLVQPNIRTEYAKLIQQRPTAHVRPMSDTPDDIKRARVNNQFLDYDWKPSGSEEAKNQALLWAIILGTGLFKWYWDEKKGPVLNDPERELSQPLGDIQVISISPFEFYPEPLAKTMNEANYVFHSKMRTSEYVWEKYHIKVADTEYADQDHLEGRIAQITSQSPAAKARGVLLNELWQRPTSKYPGGRYITKAGSQLLEAVADPYNHCRIPFTAWQHIPVPGRFWGTSIVDQLKDPQRNYNKSHSQVIESRNLMAKGKWLVPIGSMPAGKEISSAPGEVIDYVPIAGLKPEMVPAPPISDTFWRDMEASMKEIRAISGINEVSNATVPGQVRAYRAIAALQEQDDTRMVPAAMSFESSISDLEKGKLGLAKQYYTEQRIGRVLGEGNRTEVIFFSQDDIMEDADIQVDAGSSLPLTKSAKLAVLDRMWELGIVRDPRVYAKVVEFGEISNVFQSLELDTAQAERENDKMKSPEEGPIPGQPGVPVDVLAHDFDNHAIHITVHNTFRKSEEYENLDQGIQQAFQMHVEDHKGYVMRQMMEKQAAAGAAGSKPPAGDSGDEGGAVAQAENPPEVG